MKTLELLLLLFVAFPSGAFADWDTARATYESAKAPASLKSLIGTWYPEASYSFCGDLMDGKYSSICMDYVPGKVYMFNVVTISPRTDPSGRTPKIYDWHVSLVSGYDYPRATEDGVGKLEPKKPFVFYFSPEVIVITAGSDDGLHDSADYSLIHICKLFGNSRMVCKIVMDSARSRDPDYRSDNGETLGYSYYRRIPN